MPVTLDGVSYPQDRMPEILQSALDEIEYITGDVHTKWGVTRAEHSHPKPFRIQYVEIGNEDFLSTTYPERWEILRDGLQAVYPDITYISTAYADAEETFGYTIPLRPGEMYDSHDHRPPSSTLESFGFWDNWNVENDLPNATVLIGEYPNWCLDTGETDPYEMIADLKKYIFFPELISALAEAV